MVYKTMLLDVQYFQLCVSIQILDHAYYYINMKSTSNKV
jgi:hypothetical protein